MLVDPCALCLSISYCCNSWIFLQSVYIYLVNADHSIFTKEILRRWTHVHDQWITRIQHKNSFQNYIYLIKIAFLCNSLNLLFSALLLKTWTWGDINIVLCLQWVKDKWCSIFCLSLSPHLLVFRDLVMWVCTPCVTSPELGPSVSVSWSTMVASTTGMASAPASWRTTNWWVGWAYPGSDNSSTSLISSRQDLIRPFLEPHIKCSKFYQVNFELYVSGHSVCSPCNDVCSVCRSYFIPIPVFPHYCLLSCLSCLKALRSTCYDVYYSYSNTED